MLEEQSPPHLGQKRLTRWKLSRGGRCQAQNKSGKGWVSFPRNRSIDETKRLKGSAVQWLGRWASSMDNG